MENYVTFGNKLRGTALKKDILFGIYIVFFEVSVIKHWLEKYKSHGAFKKYKHDCRALKIDSAPVRH